MTRDEAKRLIERHENGLLSLTDRQLLAEISTRQIRAALDTLAGPTGWLAESTEAWLAKLPSAPLTARTGCKNSV